MDNIRVALNREAHKYGADHRLMRIKRADLTPGATLQAADHAHRAQQEAIAIRAPKGRRKHRSFAVTPMAKPRASMPPALAKDPEFYDFYRAMPGYRQGIPG